MSIFGVKLPQKDSQKGKAATKTATKPARTTQSAGTRAKGTPALPALPEKPQARAADTEKPLPSPVWPGVISAVLLGALYGTGREKVAQGLQTPILVGNAAYLGYWYFSKPKEGGDSEAETQAAAQEAAQQEVEQGPAASWPTSRYYDLADQIYAFLYGPAEDEAKAKGLMYYVKNDTDFVLLRTAYGKRLHGLPIITTEENLTAALRRFLPTSYITEINNLYAKQGMKNRI